MKGALLIFLCLMKILGCYCAPLSLSLSLLSAPPSFYTPEYVFIIQERNSSKQTPIHSFSNFKIKIN